ncbi:MAG: aspartate carbamoyltransferase [Methylococcales bacterium]|nr:aspartate carbamoyltransferase [Methylococcales bacterium]
MYKTVMFYCLLLVCLPVSAQNPHETRLDEVAERGRHVMPFDLEQTCHIFSKTPQGGVQQVIVKDQSNAPQIALIQAHLSKIAHEFSLGDFSGPAKIHGDTMPGLQTLRKATTSRLTIRYQSLANGAQITFASEEAELIAAIHLWFDAQLSDHARHAHSGHSMK